MCIRCDRYEHVADLNKGSFGVVTLAKDHENDCHLVALKRISRVEQQESVDARQEIVIHKTLGKNSGKHVAKLMDHYECADDGTIVLALEYYPFGDLYEAIRAERGPRETGTVREFMQQLIEAVQFCHSRGVYHRDIKPENILLGSDGSVKLADWGLATTSKICTDFGVGSDRYMAPELFDEENVDDYDAEKVDVWSVGICLLNVLFCRNPFTRACQKDKLFLDFCSSRESLFDIFPTMTSDTFAVLRHSLTIDPDNRSLEKMKAELANVEAWTTDEYELEAEVDGVEPVFADGDALPEVITTCNRQPLRTPTLQSSHQLANSPAVSRGWMRTMQFTPPTNHPYSLKSRLSKETKHPRSRLNLERVREDGEGERLSEESSCSDHSDQASLGDGDIDDVFLMENEDDADRTSDLNAQFPRLTVTKRVESSPSTDEEGSIDSIPSLTQSTGSIKSGSAVTTPGLSTSMNIPIINRSSHLDRNPFKFGKSWSDLDDIDDDTLFDHEFYDNILSNVRRPRQPVSSSVR
uniref:ARAD1D10472p n=1 Tax=Blastobotrys adeninivorans TaxID=409370 RepID=A0A060T8V1_BLAAD